MSTVQPAAIAAALRAAASSEERPFWVDAFGSSMGRTIVPGSEVQIVAGDRPAWGTVWAYCDATGGIVVHRCLARRGSRFVFQGDGRGHPDPTVTADVLIGRVVAARPPEGPTRVFAGRDRFTRGVVRRLAWEARRLRRRLARVAGGRRPR